PPSDPPPTAPTGIKINDTFFTTIRSALGAAVTNSVIELAAGTFNITKSDADPSNPAASGTAPPTLARFGSKVLTMQGTADAAQAPATVITGLSRIFSGQNDRGSGIPPGWTLRNLSLQFAGGSGYILQAGESGLDTSTEIDDLTFENVVFEGFHTGAVGGNDSLPWGLYLDIRAGNPDGVPDYLGFKMDRVKAMLTGQGSGVGMFDPASLPSTNGSAFLSAQGDTITIQDSFFDLSGYRNALTIANSTNVLVSGNTFTRSGFYGNRYTGEKILNVSGSIETNLFEHGSYLEFYDVYLPLSVAGNSFDLRLSGGYAMMFRDNPSDDYALITSGNLDLSNNVFRGGQVARSEILVPSQLVLESKSGASNAVEIRADTYLFDRFLVGGHADDQLDGSGTGQRDWISGDLGNDILTGGDGVDAFVFAAEPNPTTNNDVITDFTPGVDMIWLDDDVFAGLTSAPLGHAITYDDTTGELAFSGQVFVTLAGAPSLTQSDLVVF
ncbi:hypothetical protein VB738_10395, partial [Cyanobium gracile UHCC 0139]|nr:hypothetical protein [Cyanobium gracile UHCC 0139]